MSKSNVKRLLSAMSREEIIEMVLELYDVRKEAKEYLDYYVNPNEKAKLEEYKTVIKNEFFPKRGEEKCRFSVCRKVIADYRKLHPSPENLADLMLFLVEQATKFTATYGDMWGQYYTSVENNFDAAMKFISKNNLVRNFLPRINQVLEWSSQCGWGFGDSMPRIFYAYCKEMYDGRD